MRNVVAAVGLGALGAWVVACGGIAQSGSGGRPIEGVDAGPGGGAGGDGAGGAIPEAGGAFGCLACPPAAGGSGGFSSGGVPSYGGEWNAGGSGVTGGASGASCDATSDRAAITFSPLPAADGGMPLDTDVTVTGTVNSVFGNGFQLDTCGPTADCSGPFIVVTIDAPGLALDNAGLTLGSLARVHYVQNCGWGCLSAISVASVDTWHGLTNPSPALSGYYVIADDGTAVGDEPYKVDQVLIPNCRTTGGGCGGSQVTGAYLQRFSSEGGSVDVLMGDTQTLGVGGGLMTFRNLRSQVNGYCDEMGDFAHYAANMILHPL